MQERTLGQKEIWHFLYTNHKRLADDFEIIEDIAWNCLPMEQKLYWCEEQNAGVVMKTAGKDAGKLFWKDGNVETFFLEDLFSLAQYVSVCKRREIAENTIIERIRSYYEDVNADALSEDEIASKLISENTFSHFYLPDKLIIDDKEWKKEEITVTIVQELQKHLFHCDYERIELTYQYDRNEETLVYLCEQNKTKMCVFQDESQSIFVFFENRNNVGETVPIKELPQILFRGQQMDEQKLVHNRCTLHQFLLKILEEGTYQSEGLRDDFKNGFFSHQHFSNRNMYWKKKKEVGEFAYEVF